MGDFADVLFVRRATYCAAPDHGAAKCVTDSRSKFLERAMLEQAARFLSAPSKARTNGEVEAIGDKGGMADGIRTRRLNRKAGKDGKNPLSALSDLPGLPVQMIVFRRTHSGLVRGIGAEIIVRFSLADCVARAPLGDAPTRAAGFVVAAK